MIGTIRFWQARLAEAEEDLDRANAHARRAGNRRQRSEIDRLLCLVISQGPAPADEGIRRMRAMLEHGRGDRSTEIAVDSKCAELEAMLGRFDAARDLIVRAKILARELDDQVTMSAVFRDSARVEMLAGSPADAETEARAAYEILERIGSVGHLASTAPSLGDVVYALGRYDEALRLAAFTEPIAIEGDVDATVRWRQLRAKALAQRGRYDEAETLAKEAVRIVAPTDYLDLHADALVSLAEVLRLADRGPEAAAALRGALELCRLKGNLVGAARAESSLAKLGL